MLGPRVHGRDEKVSAQAGSALIGGPCGRKVGDAHDVVLRVTGPRAPALAYDQIVQKLIIREKRVAVAQTDVEREYTSLIQEILAGELGKLTTDERCKQ